MISTLRIKQFKGIEDASFNDLQDLNVLVGKNNSGKSSVLDTLWLFSLSKYPMDEQEVSLDMHPAEKRDVNLLDFAFKKDSNNPALIELGFILSEEALNNLHLERYPHKDKLLDKTGIAYNVLKIEKEFRFLAPDRFRAVIKSIHWGDLDLYIQGENWYHTEFLAQNGTEHTGKVGSGAPINTELNNQVRDLDNNFRVKFIPAVRKISLENRSSAPNVSAQPTGANIKNELLNLFHGDTKHKIDQFSLIKRVVKDISPDSLELKNYLGKDNAVDILFPTDKDSDVLVPLEVVGMGLHELLILVFSVVYFEGYTFCIEEPEIHMHAEMQRRLLDFLKKRANLNQMFIATHSTVFIDQTNKEGIFLVKKANGVTRVSNPFTTQSGEQILEELGVKRSDFLQSDGLFFVEGDFDEKVISEWSDAEGENFNKLNIQIVQMGSGYRNLHYFAEAKILQKQAIAKVPSIFLIDRDILSDGEIKKIKKSVQEIFGEDRCRVLLKHELENYLLIPSSILNVVKSDFPETEIDEEKILALIDEACEENKKLTLRKILIENLIKAGLRISELRKKLESGQPTIGDTELEQYFIEMIDSAISSDVIKVKKMALKQKVKEAFKQTTDLLDKKWDEEKRSIAPGKEVLKSLKKKLWVVLEKEIQNFETKLILQIKKDNQVPREILEIIQDAKALLGRA